MLSDILLRKIDCTAPNEMSSLSAIVASFHGIIQKQTLQIEFVNKDVSTVQFLVRDIDTVHLINVTNTLNCITM